MRALLLALALLVASCAGDATTRVAHVTIVTAGGAVAALHQTHQAVYRDATDRLRERLRVAGGTIEDYDRDVAPLDAAFRARGEAIQAIDAALYGAAAVTDAVRRGADRGAYRVAARQLLDALARGLAVLRAGAVLPPVAVPSEMDQVVAALRTVAGPEVRDGGA